MSARAKQRTEGIEHGAQVAEEDSNEVEFLNEVIVLNEVNQPNEVEVHNEVEEPNEPVNDVPLPDDNYYVERVVDKKVENSQLKYLIKWLDYHYSQNTWETMDNLDNSQEALIKFEDKLARSNKNGGQTFPVAAKYIDDEYCRRDRAKVVRELEIIEIMCFFQETCRFVVKYEDNSCVLLQPAEYAALPFEKKAMFAEFLAKINGYCTDKIMNHYKNKKEIMKQRNEQEEKNEGVLKEAEEEERAQEQEAEDARAQVQAEAEARAREQEAENARAQEQAEAEVRAREQEAEDARAQEQAEAEELAREQEAENARAQEQAEAEVRAREQEAENARAQGLAEEENRAQHDALFEEDDGLESDDSLILLSHVINGVTIYDIAYD